MKWVPAPAWAKSEAVAEVPLVSSFFARHDSADEAKSSTSRPQPYEIDAQDIIIRHGNCFACSTERGGKTCLTLPKRTLSPSILCQSFRCWPSCLKRPWWGSDPSSLLKWCWQICIIGSRPGCRRGVHRPWHTLRAYSWGNRTASRSRREASVSLQRDKQSSTCRRAHSHPKRATDFRRSRRY